MVAVVGDIHGCYNTLIALLDKLYSEYPGIELYSVGDLIDRGNFNYEVLTYILENNVKFTPGNHDYMFYYFMTDPESTLGQAWLYNGFESTIKSFKDRFDKLSQFLIMIEQAPLFYNLDDSFISHAGISEYYRNKLPEKILEDVDTLEKVVSENLASSHGILWSRDNLIDLGKLQIVGHTRKQEVDIRKSNNTAYIDTSAYGGNKLSAVIVEEEKIIKIFSEPTHPEDIV